MNVETIYQGIISLGGATKIRCTSDSMVITSISINNSTADHVFSLSRYSPTSTPTLVELYKFDLEEGDLLKDTDEYKLIRGEYLQLDSDITDTVYCVQAIKIND